MLRLASLRGGRLLRPRPLMPCPLQQCPTVYSSHTTQQQQHPKNILQRTQQFIRDNPYTKFSLSIIAILFGVSAAVELYKRIKAKRHTTVNIKPPKVCHVTIQRTELLETIHTLVNQLRKQSKGTPILHLIGEAGVGKSELAYQYIIHFASNCTKWFGLRPLTPVILYLDGSSVDMLESSLKEAALGLGVQDQDILASAPSSSGLDRLRALSLATRSKLKERNVPWLIIVDSFQQQTLPGYRAVFLNETGDSEAVLWSALDGAVVTVSRGLDDSLPQDHILHVPNQLLPTEGLELFCRLSGCEAGDEEGTAQLLGALVHHPLAIALAANTVRVYRTAMEDLHTPSYAITIYQELLTEHSSRDVLTATVELYLEAAVTDERFRHVFDFLGSCDLTRPLPVSVIARHVASPFYHVSSESLAPPPVDMAIQMQKLTGIDPKNASFWAQLKAMLPFGNNVPSTDEIAAVLATSEDPVSYLRDCPLLRFKAYQRAGFEHVQVHHSAHKRLSGLFTGQTVSRLNRDGLSSEEATFNRSSWFRSYRTFDREQALENVHRSLPGISEPGVMTRDLFENRFMPPITIGTMSSSTEGGVDYLEYQHLVSHSHRVVETLSEEVKAADHDASDILTRRYLFPHLKHVASYPLLSETDKLLCEYSQTAIEASLSVSSHQESVAKFEQVLKKQRSLFGNKSQVVARTLVDMGNLCYTVNDLAAAKSYLESSLRIYESTSSKQATKTFPLEIGTAYSSLALVCSALNEKQRSKVLLEQALAAYQTMSSEGVVSKRQRKLVSSSLTDVAHAYLSLGDVMMAKKYIDLSTMAHKNMYLDGHPESVRTLNVASIVYSMLGDKPESSRLRGEAGKQQTQLNARPLGT